MADPYRFSGYSGLFFKELYGSQFVGTFLEAAMARVCPCLFYFDGKCKIKADVYEGDDAENQGEDKKTPCVGAKVRCQYYTCKFKYLVKDYVKDGKLVLAQHIIEVFQAYLKHECSYEVVNTFVTDEEGVSSSWGEYRDSFNNRIVLPRRVFIEDDEIVSLPYHPESLEYADYLNFVTDEFFKFLFPRIIYPLDIENTVYQSDSISVLLDVPGNGYTYVIYVSELGLSEDAIAVIDNFFKTGDFVRRDNAGNVLRDGNDVQSLTWFFKQVFTKLWEKQNSDLIVNCDKIGFGVSLATLYSKYDLSKCVIIYSESKTIFNKDTFNLNEVSIGTFDIAQVINLNLDMFYCDINFASNNLYDLATGYTLDVSYKNNTIEECPKIHADYKGQDLTFGTKVSLLGEGESSNLEAKNITTTALPLPWYYSDGTTKKYLWKLNKEEDKKYELEIEFNELEKEFELGKVIIFKNVIILDLNSLVFPFYIKDCTYNSYKYITKYQAYHPMLEYYDVDPDFSFVVKKSSSGLTSGEIPTQEQANPNRTQPQSDEESESTPVVLLKSLSTGVVILVPDIEESGEAFGDTVKLKFTIVKGEKIEYFPEQENCKDKETFIPDKCDSVKHFNIKEFSGGLGTCEDPIIVEPEEDEEGEQISNISLSKLVENPFNKPYYVQINCDLKVDEGAGTVYEQADIKGVSYFYFSYLSFKFLFETLAKREALFNPLDEEPEPPDYENTDIQKILRGEIPLLSIEDLSMSQEEIYVTYETVEKQELKSFYMTLFSESVSDFHILKQLKEREEEEVSTSQEPGQQGYDFKYLYETTVRSYINNKFYEPFSIDFLLGEKESEIYEEEVKNTVEIKTDLTHVLDTYRVFGLPICGFNESKLDLNNKYTEETEESIFDKLVMENFESEFDKMFYFYIMGISKFVQDYLFFIKYEQSIIPILKRIPVIVSQVGLPDPEIKYKWKSKCSIYTYSYDTGLNPFTKIYDSENLDFFINPFYVIVHKDYREDKYRNIGDIKDNRTASKDYGFLFTSNWWLKYKQTTDTYGVRLSWRLELSEPNIFLDVYRTLGQTNSIDNEGMIIGKDPTIEQVVAGFARGKDALYIELGSIDYVYDSYCGDHDFVLGNTTPYLYDRASDHPLSSLFEDPLVAGRFAEGIAYTADYDKHGISMRRARPCSRFVGPMWFPFRACEVTRYNEFADYPGVKHFTDDQDNNYRRYIRGFSCTDLIFKPYNSDDTEFSDFKYLFIDDYFGSINPYRYVSSFYSIDVLQYYEGLGTSTYEVAPTYLASNASIPWRYTPVIFKESDEEGGTYIVIVKPREFIIGPVTSETMESAEGAEECVFLDISKYKSFEVGETGLTVTKADNASPCVTRSIVDNCLLDIPPMLPYNYNKNKYICGYERMRGGDSSFIYQCLYPYHHNYKYLTGCKYLYDYKNKGEEAYGPIENTLLPSVLPMTTDAEMVISNSVFFPALTCKYTTFMPCNFESVLFAWDWLNRDVSPVEVGCRTSAPYNPIAEGDVIPWVESNYEFWANYDELKCETDGPDLMKICLNKYCCVGGGSDYISSIFINKNSNCCSSSFMSSTGYTVTNLKTAPLYYHFASAGQQAYDYVFLGASMKSKPVFYGDGALRMFKTCDDLKKSYFIFDEEKEVNNINTLPMFGGLGKFFRMCYFSTNYGPVPFSTLSGVNTGSVSDEESNRDDNYVYKLSGYIDDDVGFANDFKYGYLPQKNPVFVTDDFSLFKSIVSFTEDDSITLKTRAAVRFRDLVQYEASEEGEESNGYYKYKGGDDIEIVTFDGEDPVVSGPAVILVYDTSVNTADKYIYYSDCGCAISIAEPIMDDMGVVVDPFPFGEKITINYLPLCYDQGYLKYDSMTLEIIGLGCCQITDDCTLDIKIKEGQSGVSNLPWMFYVESEENVIDNEGNVETRTVEVQKVYLCYDDDYKIGKLVQEDEDEDMLLSDHDVIQKGNTKYKINRGFYIDFSNMILPYTTYTKQCWLHGLNTSEFFVNMGIASVQDFCMCVDKDYSEQHSAAYIELTNDCFIISLEGSVFLSDKYEYETIVGYLALETSEEYYAVGNLIAYPKFDSSDENIEDNGKYHYTLKFFPYSNYNKVKYGGTKYRLVFRYVTFLCAAYGDLSVDVEYGRFTGGTLCEVVFNKVSSLKAITYSKSIQNVIEGITEGINLYNENLNDKLMVDDTVFYAMPFGFVHKLKLGISEDKLIKFKEGYGGELVVGLPDIEYSEEEQKILDKIISPVERDVFKLVHFSAGSIRFCLKSEVVDINSGTVVNFDMSLVPDLYKAFGYVAIPQWTAAGHKLDLYPDSFYAGYSWVTCNGAPLMKTYTCKSCLDIYKNDLDILAKNVNDVIQYNCKELLKGCGVSLSYDYGVFPLPYNVLFITHVDHGMFGYPGIKDVSDWIETPAKPTVLGFYDEDGNLIQ